MSAPLPAAHSPFVGPEAVSVLAAVTASRSEQCPSLGLSSSAVQLTVIVAAPATAGAAQHHMATAAPISAAETVWSFPVPVRPNRHRTGSE